MAKNKITDLNDHLFAQLERLGDEELTPEQVSAEVARAKAMSQISQQIINSNKLVIDAMKLAAGGEIDVPESFGIKKIGGAA